MIGAADSFAELIFEPRYDVTSAAHHLRIPRSTLDAWVNGMGSFKAVLELPKPRYLSFVNLTEAFVLSALRRRYRFKMPDIRKAIDFVEKELDVAHPLAFEQFKTDYVDLFVQRFDVDVNVSRKGQLRMAAVLQQLDRIEWQADRPVALFPILPHRESDENRPIRISPLVAFGEPVLTGTRIPTRVVANRFFGGESVDDLAADFKVDSEAIQEAVRAEREPTAA